MVDDIISLLGRPFDSVDFWQAVFEEIESGKVGVIFFAEVDGHLTNEVIGHDVAIVLTFGCSSPQLTLAHMAGLLNLTNHRTYSISNTIERGMVSYSLSSDSPIFVKFQAAHQQLSSGLWNTRPLFGW